MVNRVDCIALWGCFSSTCKKNGLKVIFIVVLSLVTIYVIFCLVNITLIDYINGPLCFCADTAISIPESKADVIQHCISY